MGHHKDHSKHKYIDTTYLTKCFTSATFFSLVSPWLPQLLAPSTMAMGFSAGQSTPHCGTQSTRISRPMSVSPSGYLCARPTPRLSAALRTGRLREDVGGR